MKKDYSGYLAKGQKKDQLRSSLDTHVYHDFDSRSVSQLQSPEKPSMNVNCKQSRATKLRDLSSNVLGTNDDI